jgi:hypothetical protein
VLSLLKRKPKAAAEIEPETAVPHRRNRQQNIKVTDDCWDAFAALAGAQGISKAALFKDMVAERLDTIRRRGMKFE